MTEIDPNLKGKNQGTGAEVLEQMPDWNEHKEELEKEKSKEQRQVDDLEVLFSFCDEKDVLEILRSDDYGVLLDNDVSLVDLFNANALFDEQYYDDGYTRDYDWRGHDDPLNAFHLFEVGDGRFQNDPMTRVRIKRREHDRNRSKRLQTLVYLQDEDFERYRDEINKGEAPEDDVIRAQEAEEAISTIANTYFGKNSPTEHAKQFKEILSLKAEGAEISEKQKEFLKNNPNTVADRLLYDGHVINEERAANILSGLDYAVNRFNQSMAKKEWHEEIWQEGYKGTLISNMAYAKKAIDDFIDYGRSDLVYEAQNKLADMTDEYFDLLVSTDTVNMSSDVDRLEAIDGLVFGYSNPYMLADRAKEFDLCEKDYDWMNYDRYVIDDPDRIVDYIARPSGFKHRYIEHDESIFILEEAKTLKELGVSDEAILRNFPSVLSPRDFTDTGSPYISRGTELLKAGIDKEKVVNKLFIDSPYIFSYNQDGGKNYVEIMEDAGLDIEEIAKASTPDVISKNLKWFLGEGADAKELVKHMMSYREKFEKNIISRDDDGSLVSSKVWFNGMQPMVVWDENHPEGRIINKFGMHGDGKDFVFANLDVLAENGVTEEDILEEMSLGDCYPFRKYVPRLLEQPQFDKQKVMDLAYKKYVERLKWEKEKGWCDDEAFEREADPQYYYTKIMEQLTEEKKKERNEYFMSVLENR